MNRWKFAKEVVSFQFQEHGYKSHVQLPTIHDDSIYFSSRDHNGKSHINRLCEGELTTVLSPSESFDKDGCMPSCFVGDRLFYSGWVMGSPYTHNICLWDGESRQPVLTPEQDESHLVNSPWVMEDEGAFRMWYVSGIEWIGNKPLYGINYAESDNLYDWKIKARDCIPRHPMESPSRPCVVKDHGKYKMYFSSMNLEAPPKYWVEAAISDDGLNWEREKIEIDSDEEMLCYPYLSGGTLFVNGGEYGQKSILSFKQDFESS